MRMSLSWLTAEVFGIISAYRSQCVCPSGIFRHLVSQPYHAVADTITANSISMHAFLQNIHLRWLSDGTLRERCSVVFADLLLTGHANKDEKLSSLQLLL